ncbi:MAG: DUF1501 domain-containing protein [Alphaproteobacteria bacterium]|nr:MAG: DUF1501 domain-containing protein [Alphaproteobacteria bacterium]
MLNRRSFLKNTGACTGAFMASSLLPDFAYANLPSENKFVLVFLNGGADQYSILAPVFENEYYNIRGQYAAEAPDGPLRYQWVQGRPVGEERALSLGHNQYALHPFMAPLLPAYAAGQLNFIMGAELRPFGVNTRSHFEETDTMMRGGLTQGSTGFLARLVNTAADRMTANPAMQTGDTNLSAILNGANGAFNFSPPAQLTSPEVLRELMVSMYGSNPAYRGKLETSFNQNTQIDSLFSDPTLRQQALGRDYSIGSFVLNCRIAATLLGGGALAPSVVFMNMFGYDSHVMSDFGWRGSHADTFRTLANGLAALRQGLIDNGEWSKTTVMVISEFGRSPQINGPTNQSNFGTDHGHGSCMMVMSGNPLFTRSAGSNGIYARAGSIQQNRINGSGDLIGHVNAYSVIRFYLQAQYNLTNAQMDQILPGVTAWQPVVG